ncbi:MAG: hypothetical protein AABO57_16980 [Acidobacteriota bacterium]
MTDDNLNQQIEEFWWAFIGNDLDRAARIVNDLIVHTMVSLFERTRDQLQDPSRQGFDDRASRILGGTPVSLIDLARLAILFNELQVFDIAAGHESVRKRLRVYELSRLSVLAAGTLASDTEDVLRRKDIGTLSEFLSALLDFEPGMPYNTSLDDTSLDQKRFTIDLSTGIMKNPADLSRNVSFKAATFGAMLGHICSQVANNFRPDLITPNPTEDIHQIRERMKQEMDAILFRSGFNAGANFGTELSEALSNKTPEMPLSERIDKWCSFDTSVGWGKFENHLTINEIAQKATGKIVLKSNFLIAEKDYNDFNICGLMKGYVAGVLKQLAGFAIEIRHDKYRSDCAQFNPEKQSCDFVAL